MDNSEILNESVALPDALDQKAAFFLHELFLSRRGTPVALDGAGVTRVGAQALQVLLAARAAWVADDEPLLLTNPSEEMLAGLALLGATPASITNAKELSA
jgi:chemotaxis protein CheX